MSRHIAARLTVLLDLALTAVGWANPTGLGGGPLRRPWEQDELRPHTRVTAQRGREKCTDGSASPYRSRPSGGTTLTEDPIPETASWRGELVNAARGVAWLTALVAGFYMIGALLAAAIFVPVFLRKVARAGYLTAVAYTTVVIVALVLLRTFAGMYLPIGYLTPPGF